MLAIEAFYVLSAFCSIIAFRLQWGDPAATTDCQQLEETGFSFSCHISGFSLAAPPFTSLLCGLGFRYKCICTARVFCKSFNRRTLENPPWLWLCSLYDNTAAALKRQGDVLMVSRELSPRKGNWLWFENIMLCLQTRECILRVFWGVFPTGYSNANKEDRNPTPLPPHTFSKGTVCRLLLFLLHLVVCWYVEKVLK